MIQLAPFSNVIKAKVKKSNPQCFFRSHYFLLFQLVISILLISIGHSSHAAEITLAWDYSDQASGYILYYGVEAHAYDNSVDVGNNTQHTVTDLSENQTYYFAVTAYNEFGESDYSDEISFATNVSTLNEPPTADAGEDQTVNVGETVILDGSYSSDPDDGIATYQWEQIEGIPINLSDFNAIEPHFTSPEIVSESEELIFSLIVTDYSGVTASDRVKIYVNDVAETPQNSQGADYCESASLTPVLGIGNMTLGNFSNLSGTNSYSDFTSKVIYVEKARQYMVSLSAEPKKTREVQYWRVWADLNHDGDFYDSGEKLIESSGIDKISEMIAFPASALDGSTRLRISMGLFDYPKPCGNIYYGEVEDYTITINQHPSDNNDVSIAVPMASILANDYSGHISISKGATISIKVELDSADYSGEYADWWIFALTPTGEWYYFDYHLLQWHYAGAFDNISTSYQGILNDLAPLKIYDLDTSNLSGGEYTFYFAIDLFMDGLPDDDAWYYDSVIVNLTP